MTKKWQIEAKPTWHLLWRENQLVQTKKILYIKANVVFVCVFITDIRELQPGRPLQGARRGATAFYTSSVNA
jgi:hypothetical protein